MSARKNVVRWMIEPTRPDTISGLLDAYRLEVLAEAEAGALVAAQSDRCPRCCCSDCGGLLAEHTETGCSCEACTISPSLACSLGGFLPDQGIGFIAGQLGPLLSVHLGEKQLQRCRAVAHAANHALRDYDRAREVRHGA